MPRTLSATPSDSRYMGQSQEPAVVTGRPRVHVPPIPLAPDVPGRRIRMVQKGWENYNGQYGPHDFVNGVSVKPLDENEVNRVAAQLHCVNLETGNQVGPHVAYIEAKPLRAPILQRLKTPDVDQAALDQAAAEAAKKAEFEASLVIYNYDQLADLVEKKGIAGLREIAAPYGVKARAIPDLIENILKAQTELLDRDPRLRTRPPAAEVAQPVQEAQEPESEADAPAPSDTE